MKSQDKKRKEKKRKDKTRQDKTRNLRFNFVKTITFNTGLNNHTGCIDFSDD